MDEKTVNGWLDAHLAPWVLALEPRLVRMGCTGVALSMPVTRRISQADGCVCGPALTALAETTMVLACARHFRAFRPVATTNLDLQFLRPARGGQIECAATLVRAGRALLFTRAVLTAEPSGKDIATATATFALS